MTRKSQRLDKTKAQPAVEPGSSRGVPTLSALGAMATTTSQGGEPMLDVGDVVNAVKNAGMGFERVEHIAGSTYKDSSTVIVIPTRGNMSHRFVSALLGLISPMNQKRAILFSSGHEVGESYNAMIHSILANPELSKWKYVMTIEDDNLIPPEAHIRLLESIEFGKFDAVSGLYFTKGDHNMPMAYGDPQEYAQTKVLDFRPRDVREALRAGQIMPVNGIAMGCALWRMSLYKEIPPPWYQTVADVVPGKGTQVFTQDLHFCQTAVQRGKRFAVDLRVRVGHLDIGSGQVF
jgi:hypothetical protein